MESLILLVLALLGCCLGSFTNVVAWRCPRRESVVTPGSHCPRCGHSIRWHDNVPVLGWLLLGELPRLWLCDQLALSRCGSPQCRALAFSGAGAIRRGPA